MRNRFNDHLPIFVVALVSDARFVTGVHAVIRRDVLESTDIYAYWQDQGVAAQSKLKVMPVWWRAGNMIKVNAMAQWTLGLCLLVALGSYHRADPGWTQSGIGVPAFNAAGVWGAWIADFLLGVFGPVAWLIPAFLFKSPLRPQANGLHVAFGFRLLALLVTLISLAALLRLHWRLPTDFLANGSGGLVGEVLGMTSYRYFGLTGSTVLFAGCTLTGLTLSFELDLVRVTEQVGQLFSQFVAWLLQQTWGRLVAVIHSYRRRKDLKVDFEREQAKFALHITNPKVKKQMVQVERQDLELGSTPPLSQSPEKRPLPVKSPAKPVERPSETVLSEGGAESVLTDPEQWNLEAMALPDIASEMSFADFGRSEHVLPNPVVSPPEPLSHALPVSPSVLKSPVKSVAVPPVAAASPSQNVLPQGALFDSMVQDGNNLPGIGLLDRPDKGRKRGYSDEALEALSRLLELKLREFNVQAEVTAVHPGPVITRFEIQPAPGVKVARISNIAKDLARSLAVLSVRVVEVIPGKSVVGVEIPNEHREIVRLAEVLSSSEYDSRESPLTLVLGKDIGGRPVVADLARMPHLLVAGTTGSGKSVGVNAMLLSILYKATPDQVRLIMIDPKMLELSIYDGIPHLLAPVVTDMKEAANALRWSVAEMERRYKLLSKVGVRNLAGYNKKVQEAIEAGRPIRDPLWKPQDLALQEEPGLLQPLPFIVVVVDEFADMMMVVGKKVEELIARIAQKARAAGIHLILATQRPSVDVITGLIKANIPTRIAFQVSSKIDSRTILDQGGAEQLLGQGDMLFLPPGSGLPERVHGAFVADEEVHRVCDHWRSRGSPEYIDEILEGSFDAGEAGGGDSEDQASAEQDPLYDQAVAFVLETRRASASFVQRRFKIGYNRAARLVEAMEEAGVVSAMGSNGQREILVPDRH